MENQKLRKVFKLRTHILIIGFMLVVFILSSCKSADIFPTFGTTVECNGQLVTPLENPTKKPEFFGGRQAFSNFFRDNVNLPQEAINRKIKGKVRVAFIVTKEGEICDVRIVSKPKEYLDNEVIRVTKMMPKWIPGINEGTICDCYYLLEIKF